jgi:hypothetical protein
LHFADSGSALEFRVYAVYFFYSTESAHAKAKDPKVFISIPLIVRLITSLGLRVLSEAGVRFIFLANVVLAAMDGYFKCLGWIFQYF